MKNIKKTIIFPQHMHYFVSLGENIRLARKRRRLTSVTVAERAGIDRKTLYQIERGNPSVSIGSYFNVLRTLGLHEDFLKIASDDKIGRRLLEGELLGKQ